MLTFHFALLQSKKRDRDHQSPESDKSDHLEPSPKKSKPAEIVPPAGAVKKAGSIPSRSFRSPLRDTDINTSALKRARDILAYAEAGNRELFLSAIKLAFEEMTLKNDGRSADAEYPHVYLGLIYVSKVASSFILSSSTAESGSGDEIWRYLLERLSTSGTDAKRSSEVAVLACNMLYQAFRHLADWPIEFVQAYLEDSFGPRLWVDDESCRPFIRELLTVTPQDMASETLVPDDDAATAASRNSPFGSSFISNHSTFANSINRFQDVTTRERVSIYASQIVEFHLSTLSSQQTLFPSPSSDASDSLKNLIRTVPYLLPYTSVRVLVARHLDGWLHHPQTSRLAKELFRRLAINVIDPTSTDTEVVRLILRFKNAPNSCAHLFFPTLSKLASAHPHFRKALLRDILSDILVAEANSPAGGLPSIGRLFESCLGSQASGMPAFAEVIHTLATEMAFSPNLKLLVPLLLSSWPSSAPALSPALLCSSLCNSSEPINLDLFRSTSSELPEDDTAVANRVAQWARSLAETFAAILIFSIPKTLYDLVPVANQGIRANLEQENHLRAFAEKSSSLMLSAIQWCSSTLAPIMHSISISVLPAILSTFLLLDPISSYYLGPQPLSADQLSSLSSVISSIPCTADASSSLFSVKSILLSPESTIDLHEQLILRALKSPHQSLHLLPSWNFETFIRPLLQLCIIQPNNTDSEINTTVKGWAHPARLWKAFGVMTLASPFIGTVGEVLWNRIPIGRMLMEMVLTRSWLFNQLGARWLRRLSPPNLTKYQIVGDTDGHPIEMDLVYFSTDDSVLEPPASLLSSISNWEVEFKLSIKLLSSTQPDYVSNLVASQGTGSAKWLSQLILADSNLINLLSPLAIYTLLMSSLIGPSSSHYIPSVAYWEPQLFNALSACASSSSANMAQLLRSIFADIIHGSDSNRASAYYILGRVVSSYVASVQTSGIGTPSSTPLSHSPAPFSTRSSSPHSGSSPDGLNSSNAAPRPSVWLINLSKLPHYTQVHSLIEASLMKILQEESDMVILSDIAAHLAEIDRPVFSQSPQEIDHISLGSALAGIILRLSLGGNTGVLIHTAVLDRFVSLFSSILSTSAQVLAISPKAWNDSPETSLVRWNLALLPASTFQASLTLLTRIPDISPHHSEFATMASLLMSGAPLEFPIGSKLPNILTLFAKLDPSSSELLAQSSWSSHFHFDSNKIQAPIRLAKVDLWSRVGVQVDSSADSEMIESPNLGLSTDNNLTEVTLMLSKENADGSNILIRLQRGRMECESSLRLAVEQRHLLPQSISDFHQSCVKIASHAHSAQYQHISAELNHEISSWQSSLASALHDTSDPKLAFQLSQELSLLLPFRSMATDLRQSSESDAFRWGVASLFPLATDASSILANSQEVKSLLSLVFTRYSPSNADEIVFLAHWLAKIGELQDCLPFITLAFNTHENRQSYILSRIAMECLHREGSWATNRVALEYLLGPIYTPSTSAALTSEGLHTLDKASTDSKTQIIPISSLNVDLALDYLALCLEADDDHSEQNSITSSPSRPTLLRYLSKPQLLRISDLIMVDLTSQPSSESTINKNSIDRVERRARLLMHCCSGAGDSVRDEKALWVIEHLSQMPGAYSMNTMQWLNDMALASYGAAKPTTARPDLLVARVSSLKPYSTNVDAARVHLSVDEASEALLKHLYFEYPWEVFSIIKHFTNRVSATTVYSKLDYMLHRLLQRLSSESPALSESALLALRTCAYSHPAFIVKFMPTMTSLLNGKMQQGSDAFYAANGPQILKRVLGVVEMLVPLVLHDSLAKARLHSMLNEYFRILSALFLGNGHARPATIHLTEDPNKSRNLTSTGDHRIEPFVSSFAYFLAAYCNEPLVIHEAVEFLTPHLETIEAMSIAFPSLVRLRAVVASLKENRLIEPLIPPIDSEELIRIQSTFKRFREAIESSLATHPSANHSINPAGSAFDSETLGQVLEALKKVELATAPSSAHCSVLNFLIADITPLSCISVANHHYLDKEATSHPFRPYEASPFAIRTIESIRRSSLRLCLLFLHCFPRSSEGVVSAFVSCLTSPSPEVRSDALPHARDVFISCIPGKQQTDIMISLFNMGKHGQSALTEILSFVADLS